MTYSLAILLFVFQICTWSLIVCFFAKTEPTTIWCQPTEHPTEGEESLFLVCLIIHSLVVGVAAPTFSVQLNATNKGKMQ